VLLSFVAVALMLTDPVTTSALARDTVFATVMIICNGTVGLCWPRWRR